MCWVTEAGDVSKGVAWAPDRIQYFVARSAATADQAWGAHASSAGRTSALAGPQVAARTLGPVALA